MRTHAETERRRRLVADHRATVGDWCPGLEDHPAHPSADLVADHVIEVAIGGLETGRYGCCAAARTAAEAPEF
jgi:5-methylcytosine-specific restriction enzyme A